jgi:hypothetical protein
MPLYRSARLFTLGLALAGSCAAQTPDTLNPQRQMKQQQNERKALRIKQQRKAASRAVKMPSNQLG